jgi:hypothetical protein
MKRTFFIAGTILLAACSSPSAEQASEEVKTEIKEKAPLETRNLVKEYREFVETLNLKSEQSVTAAAEKYAELFSGIDKKVCDSAYVFFEELYEKVGNSLNEKLMNDPFFEEFPCVSLDSLGVKELPFEKKFAPFKKSIEKNGFKIDCLEGMGEIAEDRSFVAKHFYAFVSPVTKQYLEGLQLENDQLFSGDAGINISPQQYADRLVWWENFNKRNPDFILSKRARSIQRHLFTFFLLGMDNTPLINYFTDDNGVEKQELDSYFVDAYAYLNKKYPNSESNALVKPYKMTVLKNDNAKRERLIKTYTNRGLMIDFSKEY